MNYESLLNKIVLQTPPSGIRKYFDIAAQMEDCISLGVGEPDFITPWYIREAGMRSIMDGHTCYTSNAGKPELRELICRYYQERFGASFDPAQVLITVGASEGIDLAFRAILNPGDEALIVDPGYTSYMPAVSFAGGIPVSLAPRPEDDFKIRPDLLRNAITQKTKAVVLSYPNNPTGALMSREELTALCDVIKERDDIFVISDEIYAELIYTDERFCSVASIPDMAERCITLNGFSKAFAMTGWRLGYAIAPQPVLDQMLKVHQLTMLCASNLSQDAGIAALKIGFEDNFSEVEKMRKDYNRRRRYLIKTLREIGLDCFEPFGAFYAFPSIEKSGMDCEDFCEKLLYQEKLAIVPGTAFGANGSGHIRISYAYSMDHLQKAMDRLDRFWRSLT